MDFFEIMNNLLSFFQDNLVLTIALVCMLLFLLYWKPKLFFAILFLILLLIGIFYVITDVTSSGLSHKKKLLNEKGVPLESTPIYLKYK